VVSIAATYGAMRLLFREELRGPVGSSNDGVEQQPLKTEGKLVGVVVM